MEETINIRLANDIDFDNIYKIWLEGIDNSFDTSGLDVESIKEKFLENFNSRNGIFNFWVAADSTGEIQGWQSLIRTFNNPLRQESYAESSTYIAKHSRFSGLGLKLLNHAISEAETSNLEYIIGFISTNNEAAKKITTGTGWITMGEIPESKKGNNKFRKLMLVKVV